MKDADELPERRAEIAVRLREARKAAGLSQGQVARLLGLHRPTVSTMEAGTRRVSAEELAQLAETYDVSVSWLACEGESKMATDPRVELAARELRKLNPKALDRLLRLLASLRDQP